MISILAASLALAFPLLQGVLLLHLIEGKHPVLYRLERYALGLLAGGALSAFVLFWLGVLGMPLRFLPFLIVHMVLLLLLIGLAYWRFPGFTFPASPVADFSLRVLSQRVPRWVFCILVWLIVWTVLKALLGTYDLLFTPAYWNDVYANWHMRTKAFYTAGSLMLDLPTTNEFFFGGRVPGYPLTVYLTKLWAVLLRGAWSEIALNTVNAFWFFALVEIFFAALKRVTNTFWSIVGVFLLLSMPLLMVHAATAYSDILMAAHLFAVLFAFYQWLSTEMEEKQTWFRLFVLFSAAMLFVKNEALLIFLPPLLLLVAVALFLQKRDVATSIKSFALYLAAAAAIAVPWSVFKIVYGLTFGNAQKVSGFTLEPHAYVLSSIEMDLLYTGSYLLLFPLIILLLALTVSHWTRNAVGFLIAFLAIVFFGEIAIYWLTPLATEAIRHTGFGRGMVHLLPGFVFVCVLLFCKLFGANPFSRER